MPTLGDVDGDGFVDVVLASPGFWLTIVLSGEVARAGGIRAWRADGVPIDFQPDTPADGLVMESAAGASWHRYPSAALVDLDGDGRLDIVAATVQDRAYSPTAPLVSAKQRSSLYAWELPVVVGTNTLEWAMAQGGPARTGRYYRPPPPNQAPQIRFIPNQTIATGGTFRSIPLDRYVDDPDHAAARMAWTIDGAQSLWVEMDAARAVTVTMPSPEWSGTETLRFTVRDPAGATATTSVVFSARVGYQPPVAAPDLGIAAEDTEGVFAVVDNDRSPTGRSLRVAGVSRPAHGRARLLATGQIAYEPEPDFFGADLVEYVIIDDDGGSAVGELRLEVAAVNDAPRPAPDRLILDEDTEGDLDLGSNDEEVDGDELVLVSITAPEHGTLEPAGPLRFRFKPAPDFSGTDAFSYLVRDPAGLMATGQVAVLVKPVNDAPVSRSQTVPFNRNRGGDVFYETTDVDGDKLSYTVLDGPQHGVLLAYPSFAYFDPARGFVGTDRFTYSVSDGLTTVGPTEVTMVVEARNNPPTVDPVSTVTAEDQPLTIGLTVGDADADPVVVRVTSPPDHGVLQLEGTNAVYQPEPGFVGTDAFEVAGADAEDEGKPAEVVVRVTDVNTPPRAVSEVRTVARNQPTGIVLRAVDDENNPLLFQVMDRPSIGQIEGTAPSLTYLPPAGFRGLDRLTFTARDRFSTSEVATVHLLVRDPNTPPHVTNQTFAVLSPSGGRLRLSAADADGHGLRLALMKGPKSGRIFGLGTSLEYRPDPGFQGRDEFTYKVWDGITYSAEARVTVVVRSREALAPRWGPVRVTASGLQLEGYAEAGLSLQIEVSTDLKTWELLGVTPNPGGVFQWLDAGWNGRTGAVYRAVLPVDLGGNPAIFVP